jgi:F420-non-reducing hydrogenase small subunit
MSKPKIALYWASSCGGCEIAVLGIHEKILDVANAFDIVLWPCVLDGKIADVKALDDGELLFTLFNGAIRNDENYAMAQLLRRKSQVLVAFGSCAYEGCIPGLGNFNNRRQMFDWIYHNAPTTHNPGNAEPVAGGWDFPEGHVHIPAFWDTVKTLGQVVKVDYYLPGCPPEAERIWEALTAILENTLPPAGSVIGANVTVCDECPRAKHEKKIKRFYRPYEIIPDPELCLLEQGILCAGIATRSGCGALCPQVGMLRRLLWSQRGGSRPGCALLERCGLGDRQPGPGRDRGHPGHHRRPGRHLLPLQLAPFAAASRGHGE